MSKFKKTGLPPIFHCHSPIIYILLGHTPHVSPDKQIFKENRHELKKYP